MFDYLIWNQLKLLCILLFLIYLQLTSKCLCLLHLIKSLRFLYSLTINLQHQLFPKPYYFFPFTLWLFVQVILFSAYFRLLFKVLLQNLCIHFHLILCKPILKFLNLLSKDFQILRQWRLILLIFLQFFSLQYLHLLCRT